MGTNIVLFLQLSKTFQCDLSDFRYLSYNIHMGNALRMVFLQFHYYGFRIMHIFAYYNTKIHYT